MNKRKRLNKPIRCRDKYPLSLLLFLWLSLPLIVVAGPRALMPSEVDRLTQQWLDIERQVASLKTDWIEQQPMLKQQKTLLLAEKTQLLAMLEQKDASEGDVDERRARLMAEQTQLEQEQLHLEQALSLLSSELERMALKLPPMLLTAWQAEQGTQTHTSSIERDSTEQLQRSLAQLNLLADFDQRVSVHEGVIPNVEAQPILVKQLFLGLGMAWFVSRDGERAGWGKAEANAWHWHFDDSVDAKGIAQAIAIYEKQQNANLVRLPLYLSHVEREGLEPDLKRQQQQGSK